MSDKKPSLRETGPAYRTKAFLAEDPSDDGRLHHIFWEFQLSYNPDKAALGLGEITRHEVSSCLILCGSDKDITLADALQRMQAYETETAKSGGQEIDPNDDYAVKKMGGDYARAHHLSQFDDDQKAAIAKVAQDATQLGRSIRPMAPIRFKSPKN